MPFLVLCYEYYAIKRIQCIITTFTDYTNTIRLTVFVITGLKEFNVSKLPSTPQGIFNGKSFVLSLGFSSIINKFILLWNYGFSLFKMSHTVRSIVKKFSSIYKMQAKGEMFKTVPDMLNAMGGEKFCSLTKVYLLFS